MIRQHLKRFIRILLASLCFLMLLSLSAQGLNFLATIHEARSASTLREKIAPAANADIEGIDLSAFADLPQAPLFFPAPNKEAPPPALNGLLGEFAILNGKIGSKGDEIDGWKIEEVRSEKVIVTHGEQRQELVVADGKQTLVIDGRGDKKDLALDASQRPPQDGGRGSGGGGGRRRMLAAQEAQANTPDQASTQETSARPAMTSYGGYGDAPETQNGDQQKAVSGSGRRSMEEFSRRSPEEMAEFLSKRTGREVSPEEIRQRMEEMRERWARRE